MSKKCTPLWREAHFEVKMYKTHQLRTTFRSCDVEKAHAVVARSTFRSQHVKNTRGSDHFWRFRCRFAWQAQGIVHLGKSDGFVAFPKRMAGVGHLKRICKDAFSVAGAVQKTCSSEMLGGQGADFLREVAFWSIRVQHFVWPGINFSWQAQYFRQVEWKSCKTHWYEAVSAALNFSFLKEVL